MVLQNSIVAVNSSGECYIFDVEPRRIGSPGGSIGAASTGAASSTSGSEPAHLHPNSMYRVSVNARHLLIADIDGDGVQVGEPCALSIKIYLLSVMPPSFMSAAVSYRFFAGTSGRAYRPPPDGIQVA